MFIGFANFYQYFIQSFSKIAVLFPSLLKATRLSKLALKAFKVDNNKIIGDDDSRANKTFMNLSKNNKSRDLTYMPNIGAIGEPYFLTSNTKKVFNYLRLTVIKVLILRHFDLKIIFRLKLMHQAMP